MASYNTYLSSTFADLKDYRAEVIKLLNRLRETFVLEAMEIYVSDGQWTLDKCLNDVAGCDIYILLLANKYGSIPENRDDKNKNGWSYTHLEYETARKLGKKVWVYIAKDTAPKDVLVQDDGEERETKQALLGVLKNDASQFSPTYFQSPLDLVQEVSASILKLARPDPNVKNKYVDPDAKHCCNRSEQFLNYQQNRLTGQSGFHLFVGNGFEEDIPGNLTNRCAIFSMHVPENKIFTFSFTDFFTSESPEKNLYNFLFRLHDRIDEQSKITTTSSAELLRVLKEVYPYDDIIISIDTYEDMFSEARTGCISQVILALNGLFEPGVNSIQKRMYFFLYIQDNITDAGSMERSRDKIGMLRECLKGKNVRAVYFDRFSTVNREHVESWIDQYITTDQLKVRKLYKQGFSGLPPESRMQDVEAKIRMLIEGINKNEKPLIDILNS
jgi:hypothetical protein